MNISIPHFYAKCTGIDLKSRVFDCVVHAARSRAGKILTFHVHLESGVHYSLLPLHKLFHGNTIPEFRPEQLQEWDCFSDDCEVISYDYFKGKNVWVIPMQCWGEYLMTFDWLDNQFSDYAPEFKQGHLIRMFNGSFGVYPNNRLLFEDKTYTNVKPNEVPHGIIRQSPEDYVSVETNHIHNDRTGV